MIAPADLEAMLRAFAQGRRAEIDGKPESDNPWRPCSDAALYDAWRCGWHESDGPAYKVAG
jgi:hypothetical protein